MIEEYLSHNRFWDDPSRFDELDPHLSLLKGLKFIHPFDWWKEIDWKEPGIYILTGGRQIGKSTSTKLLIKYLIEKKQFSPRNIFYLPCDQVDDHHHLTRVIRSFLEERTKGTEPFLLIADEVTFVTGWDRGIKALADEGLFRRGFCILTGSDTLILKEAAVRFPGRRGDATKTDFHLYPLTFREYIHLVKASLLVKSENQIDKLFEYFENYQICGGFLRAINELHSLDKVKDATYSTFEQWIKGDIEKRGKKINNLEEILSVLFQTLTTQVTYSALCTKTGHVSKDTLIDYCNLLERMDILNISEAFDQNKLRGFPKKARKFYFSDPFIIDVIERWLTRERLINRRLDKSSKVESIVASNCRRHLPVYYIKAEGEVDVVLITGRRFTPIEIKWSLQLKERDIKQVSKYKNALILTKQLESGEIKGIRTIPLPLFLVQNISKGS